MQIRSQFLSAVPGEMCWCVHLAPAPPVPGHPAPVTDTARPDFRGGAAHSW